MNKILIALLLLLLPWGGGVILKKTKSQKNMHCNLHGSVLYIYKNGDIHYSNGFLKLNTLLNGYGNGSYSGEIVYKVKNSSNATVLPVNISFTYYFEIGMNGVSEGEITKVSEDIGNKASQSQVAQFMGPVLNSKKSHITKMYMIDGVKPAWGTPASPGIVCTK